MVGLTDRARDGVSQLSGGQQQRTLIARALAGEPDLFFLDEPTAGVDLPNQLTLATSLSRLKERGATIVLVAHELGPLARAGRPLGGDARRTGGLRRRAARRPRRPPPGVRRAARHHHHPDPARRDHVPRVASPFEPVGRGEASDGPVHLRLHAAGADRRGRHRAGRARGRHLPGPAPAGPDGRRHRSRRGHRCRAGAAHRHLADVDGGGRRDHRRRADRADPRARPQQRRRRAGAAVLRRPGRRRAAHRDRRPERGAAAVLPVRLDHHDLGRATCWSRWCWPRS